MIDAELLHEAAAIVAKSTSAHEFNTSEYQLEKFIQGSTFPQFGDLSEREEIFMIYGIIIGIVAERKASSVNQSS